MISAHPSAPAIFIDKDGTLIEDVPFNVDPDRITLMPGAAPALASLVEAGYRVVVVSNQSGVARGFFDEEELQPVEHRIRQLLAQFGIPLDGFYYCPHLPQGRVDRFAIRCQCRKPAPGMLIKSAGDLCLDLSRSWLVGDILDDVSAGNRAGCRTILVNSDHETQWRSGRWRRPGLVARDILAAARAILATGASQEIAQ
jgi:histidinol-phosphate phosphatase family protein